MDVIQGKCPHPECEYPANPDPRVSAAGFCCEKCEARFNGEPWGFEKSSKPKKNKKHTGACTCHTWNPDEGSFMIQGAGGKKQKLEIPKQTGPRLCTIHAKKRRMRDLENDGMGGFLCYPGYECDPFGPEEQLGAPDEEEENAIKEVARAAKAEVARAAKAAAAAAAPTGSISNRLNGIWNDLNSGKSAATASSGSWAGADDSWGEQPSDAGWGKTVPHASPDVAQDWGESMSFASPDVVADLLAMVGEEEYVEEAPPAAEDSWSGGDAGDASWGEESWPATETAPSKPQYAWAQPPDGGGCSKGAWGKGSGDDWGKGSKAGDDWGKGSKGAWGKDSGDAWGMSSKGSKDSGGGWGKGADEGWELAWVPKGTTQALGLEKGGAAAPSWDSADKGASKGSAGGKDSWAGAPCKGGGWTEKMAAFKGKGGWGAGW